MAIQPYPVHDYETGEECLGAVLINTVSGHPLPLQIGWFRDVDDALAFEEWLRAVYRDEILDLPPDLLGRKAAEWDIGGGREQWQQLQDQGDADG